MDDLLIIEQNKVFHLASRRRRDRGNTCQMHRSISQSYVLISRYYNSHELDKCICCPVRTENVFHTHTHIHTLELSSMINGHSLMEQYLLLKITNEQEDK